MGSMLFEDHAFDKLTKKNENYNVSLGSPFVLNLVLDNKYADKK